MRYLFFMLFVLCFQIACQSFAQKLETNFQQVKTERKPFRRSPAVIKSPTEYAMRERGKKEYDPRPTIVTVDSEAGKYELRWTGYDGKEKRVKYQKQDAINAAVEARIEKTSDGKYEYKYRVRNFPTSPTYLHSFTVQTFAHDIRDEPLPIADDVFTSHMAQYIPDFKEGLWRYYARLGNDSQKIHPGSDFEFNLVSSGLPGIVGCRSTAGEHVLKGGGEHIPQELEFALPGYEGWARGYTIGPIDKLSGMTKIERVKYVLENLPKFEEAGWMAGDTPKIYEAILKRNDLAGALEQARKDLEKGFITSEVFHIIEGLNN